MGGVATSRPGDRGGTKPSGGGPVTLVELKVLLCELDDRALRLHESEGKMAAGGRWAQRREFREQRHRLEIRIAGVQRRIRAMEATW